MLGRQNDGCKSLMISVLSMNRFIKKLSASAIQSHNSPNSCVNGSKGGRTARILYMDELNSLSVVGIVLRIKHMSSKLENVTGCGMKSGPYTYVENSTPASNAIL